VRPSHLQAAGFILAARSGLKYAIKKSRTWRNWQMVTWLPAIWLIQAQSNSAK